MELHFQNAEPKFVYLCVRSSAYRVFSSNFNTKVIEQFSSNTSFFIVCEATCFGPYMTIIRPSYESSQ